MKGSYEYIAMTTSLNDSVVRETDLRLYYHVYSKREESLYERADQEPTHECIAMTTSPSDSTSAE